LEPRPEVRRKVKPLPSEIFNKVESISERTFDIELLDPRFAQCDLGRGDLALDLTTALLKLLR
jgi:hypothetical protein